MSTSKSRSIICLPDSVIRYICVHCCVALVHPSAGIYQKMCSYRMESAAKRMLFLSNLWAAVGSLLEATQTGCYDINLNTYVSACSLCSQQTRLIRRWTASIVNNCDNYTVIHQGVSVRYHTDTWTETRKSPLYENVIGFRGPCKKTCDCDFFNGFSPSR